MIDDETIVITRDALSALMINNDSYSPRTVVLQRGKKGFGFVLRGCRGKFNTFTLNINNRQICLFRTVVGSSFQPTASFPALQFLDSIEKGSNADKAGLKQYDYVLEVIRNKMIKNKKKGPFPSIRSMESMSFQCHMKNVFI